MGTQIGNVSQEDEVIAISMDERNEESNSESMSFVDSNGLEDIL